MRTWVPPSAGVNVQSTTESSPKELQRYESCFKWSTISTSQLITPSQFGMGSDRNWKLPPDHRFKVIVHQPLGDERVLGERAPQLFWRVREYPLDHNGT